MSFVSRNPFDILIQDSQKNIEDVTLEDQLNLKRYKLIKTYLATNKDHSIMSTRAIAAQVNFLIVNCRRQYYPYHYELVQAL